ncbi:hypothetical protein VTL71DRAFT_15931 [Oculimacula yallundae]|uniref:Non-reducing end beta-L-arabinofuranosidase n=1 Tax=Oculimacula yallundae TaxID=86028 RepID=A0ABR4CD27_9HELO
MAYPQETFLRTSFSPSSFIQRRRSTVFESTLLYQLDVLKKTGRYDAFKLKWHPTYDDPPDVWPIPNHLFWDSDVAKWIEGACYFLSQSFNGDITAAVEELVDMIRAAQQPDGYLNIHFTVVAPGQRFTNLRDLHELYNAGHLIEAALAHHQLFGNDLFLAPICKYAGLLCDTFGPKESQRHGYPGHPEIELSLLRLTKRTEDSKYGELAKYFLEERGNPAGQNGKHYYDFESEARGDSNVVPEFYPAAKSYWYNQAHRPIIEQPTIEGHSVRAMYLFTALADQVRLSEPKTVTAQRAALERLWSNMVERKMSLTGGIGAEKQWEGFGIDYFLPQSTDEGGCYNETCAAIGVMMLAERMLQIDLNREYADVMELCFFNAVTTAMSSCGTRFTYVNQLASSDTDLSRRQEWFTCACCPPNVTRLLGCIGGYLWSYQVDSEAASLVIDTHMYSTATISIPFQERFVSLSQRSNWPWDGRIEFELASLEGVSLTMRLRIPGWATDWKLSPPLPDAQLEKGYLVLPFWYTSKNDKFELDISLKTRLLSPHPYTNQNVMAVARGPIIYCLEDADNPWVDDHFKSLFFDPAAAIMEKETVDPTTGERYVSLTATDAAYFLQLEGGENTAPAFVSRYKERADIKVLNFVPYALRDNREGRGHMRVGLRKRE